jgi:ParB family chromosome partitioning protein
MARGGTRKNLADLINAVGDNSPVDGAALVPPTAVATSAPLAQLVANPRNPREDLGDLSDLESIAQLQLQPALVVTREAYLRLYPEDRDAIGTARWLVVNGCRRLAAARTYGRTELEFVVKDEVAADRVTLLSASITENVARQGFDVIEEARAVEALVSECETAEDAAAQLKKSPGWVSQRRALLKLAPELQIALRRGDLAVRVARSLAKAPLEQQVVAWQAAQERQADKEGGEDAPKPPRPPRPASAPQIAKILRRFEPEPGILAQALRDYLDPVALASLVDELRADR